MAGLAFFYYKYVPLVKPYQLALVPILVAAAFLAWLNLRAGTLLFIFLFPLINNLPYFFGIHEPIPQAPAALVLFLFYALGYLLRGKSMDEDGPAEGAMLKPIALFSLVVGVSAIITFLRYANFFPFLNSDIYELAVNRQGVRAGGAIMSVVLQALNYLSGCAFFLIASRLLRSKEFLRKALLAFGCASLLSLAFAAFQHFGHLATGNNPASIGLRLINGTFKDALSFGAYLSMAVPLFLGVFFAFRNNLLKVISALVVVFSLVVIVFTGSKSGIIGLAAALLLFFILGLRLGFPAIRRPAAFASAKSLRAAAAVILIGAVLFSLLVIAPRLKNSNIGRRFENSKDMLGVRLALLWKPALRMMTGYPFTGVGLGGFIIEVANYSDAYDNPETLPESAENYILQVGSELGLIGLGLVAWILWEILRRVRKGLSRKAADAGARFLVIGAASGGLAFVIDAQAHSFIGSYEIKYAFWLLIALIFAATYIPPAGESAKSEAPEPAALSAEKRGRKTLSDRRFIMTAAALLVVYGAIHLWNSSHSLSLRSRTEQFAINREFGLDKPEKTAEGREFRWTREYGGIRFKIEKADFVIPLSAAHPDIQKRPVKVKIYLVQDFFKRKRLLKEITLTRSLWQDVALSAPGEVGREAVLLVTVSRTWNPRKMTGVPDARNLGVAVGKIEFKDKK
jgi:hypothetical protein